MWLGHYFNSFEIFLLMIHFSLIFVILSPKNVTMTSTRHLVLVNITLEYQSMINYLSFDAIWMCCMHYWRHQSKIYIPCPFSLSIFLFVYSYDCPVYFSKCCLPMPKLIFLGGLLCCVNVIVHAIQMRWPSLVCKVEKNAMNGIHFFLIFLCIWKNDPWLLFQVLHHQKCMKSNEIKNKTQTNGCSLWQICLFYD